MNQLQIQKKISGEKRLEQAFYLSDFVRELAIKDIKKQLGKRATKKVVIDKLRQRLYKEY